MKKFELSFHRKNDGKLDNFSSLREPLESLFSVCEVGKTSAWVLVLMKIVVGVIMMVCVCLGKCVCVCANCL